MRDRNVFYEIQNKIFQKKQRMEYLRKMLFTETLGVFLL